MGWQTFSVIQLFAGNTIINPNGIFEYSGPPAAGNLISSIAPAAGTDQFGNAYQAGIVSYNNANNWGQLVSGNLFFQSAAGQAVLSEIFQLNEAELALTSGSVAGGAQAELFLEASDSVDGGGLAKAILQADTVTLTTTTSVTVTTPAMTVTGTLSVNGSTSTAGPSTANTSTNGLTNGQIAGTSGAASAGTAHTHGPGSYAVTNGQHNHTLSAHTHVL